MLTQAPAPAAKGGYYLVDGQKLVRVTTVVNLYHKPFLLDWLARLTQEDSQRIKNEAREFGNRLHALCEYIATCRTVVEDGPSDLMPFAQAYTAWFNAQIAEVVAVEHFVVSRRWGVAGKLDLLARLRDGRLALIDLKSSKPWPRTKPKPDPCWAIQLAAYATLLAEQDGLAVDTRLVVQMPREQPGQLYVHEFGPESLARDWNPGFLSLLGQFRYQEGWAYA